MLYVSDVIRRNSRYSGDDDESFENYWDIIHDREITADAIRDELLAKGVEIKDTREGVKWNLI